MCNGDDLIFNPLFNFEPMKRLEHWEDVRMFGSASNSTCKWKDDGIGWSGREYQRELIDQEDKGKRLVA